MVAPFQNVSTQRDASRANASAPNHELRDRELVDRAISSGFTPQAVVDVLRLLLKAQPQPQGALSRWARVVERASSAARDNQHEKAKAIWSAALEAQISVGADRKIHVRKVSARQTTLTSIAEGYKEYVALNGGPSHLVTMPTPRLVANLAALNAIEKPNLLHPGRALKVPWHAGMVSLEPEASKRPRR